MGMNVGAVGANGNAALESARWRGEGGGFDSLVKSMKSSAAVGARSGGAKPCGMAAGQTGSIDKSSRLYEKSLELETFMVKIMLSSMRETVGKAELFGGDSYASRMYEDMMFDQYASEMARNAGFGIADAVYLQLDQKA